VPYPEAVQFLYSLGNEVQTAKLGLDRIRTVLQALGNPQSSFRVVHVAGTNGKGSTCAMIEAGLRAAAQRTGLYTSPHLLEPTERIQIGGLPVSQDDFARAFDVVHETAIGLPLDCHPTYFETITAMAFWLFREKHVETAVVEVGLGGRLDATNVVQPLLTVITPIDYDHQNYLGDTIEEIAGEKAGILKPGIPAVFAPQREAAATVLLARAKALKAPVIDAATFPPSAVEVDERESRFRTHAGVAVRCPLAGEHQVENAVTATLALEQLGVAPDGIAEARWPGRLEHVAPNPDIILDGAHNPAGARALAQYLKRFYGHRKLWMIFGAMGDKAVGEVAGILFPIAQELMLTAPSNARALSPEKLRQLAGRGRTAATAAQALELVREEAESDDAIVVTGSLYLVGEARGLLSRHVQRWN
jgi:dihydrofolate synthase/folylpolyglutamate synthase